jgi:hypothetical protein
MKLALCNSFIYYIQAMKGYLDGTSDGLCSYNPKLRYLLDIR